jgi:hypothetical protein
MLVTHFVSLLVGFALLFVQVLQEVRLPPTLTLTLTLTSTGGEATP